MEKLKLLIAKYVLKKYALGYIVSGYSKLKGWKTQIFMGLCVLAWAGQLTGYITPEQAEQLYAVFGSAGGVALLQKLQRYEPMIKELAEEAKKKI